MDPDCVLPDCLCKRLAACGRTRIRSTLRHLGASPGSRIPFTDFVAAYNDLFHEHFYHCEFYRYFGVKRLEQVAELVSDTFILRNEIQFVVELEVICCTSDTIGEKPAIDEQPDMPLRPYPRYSDSIINDSEDDVYGTLSPSPPLSPLPSVQQQVSPRPPQPVLSVSADSMPPPSKAIPSPNAAKPSVPLPMESLPDPITSKTKVEQGKIMGPFVSSEQRKAELSRRIDRALNNNTNTKTSGMTQVVRVPTFKEASEDRTNVNPVRPKTTNTPNAESFAPVSNGPATVTNLHSASSVSSRSSKDWKQESRETKIESPSPKKLDPRISPKLSHVAAKDTVSSPVHGSQYYNDPPTVHYNQSSTSARDSTLDSSARSSPFFELDPIEPPPVVTLKKVLPSRTLNKPDKSCKLGDAPLRPAFSRSDEVKEMHHQLTGSDSLSESELVYRPVKPPPSPRKLPETPASSSAAPAKLNTKKKVIYTVSDHKYDAEYTTSDSD